MSRVVTLIGYVVLVALLILHDARARRARVKLRERRPLTFGEFVDVARLSPFGWLLLVGWLWLGWHLFARVRWR